MLIHTKAYTVKWYMYVQKHVCMSTLEDQHNPAHWCRVTQHSTYVDHTTQCSHLQEVLCQPCPARVDKVKVLFQLVKKSISNI